MRHFLRVSGGLAVLLILASAGPATVAGPCLEVDSPGQVQLPDGRRFDARSVQLCLGNPFTPSSSIVEVRINGASVGRFLAEVRPERAGRSEYAFFVTFDRLGSDLPYHLASMTLTQDGQLVSHRLRRVPGWQVAGSRGKPGPAEPDPAIETVALAAHPLGGR